MNIILKAAKSIVAAVEGIERRTAKRIMWIVNRMKKA